MEDHSHCARQGFTQPSISFRTVAFSRKGSFENMIHLRRQPSSRARGLHAYCTN